MRRAPPKFNTVPKRLIPEDDRLKEYVENLVKKSKRIIPKEFVKMQNILDVVNLNVHISFKYEEVSDSLNPV